MSNGDKRLHAILLLALSAAQAGCRSGVGCCAPWFASRASSPFDATAPRTPPTLDNLEEVPRPEDEPRPRPTLARPASLQLTPVQDTPVSPPRFQIPSELPGANAPPLRLPPFDPSQSLPDRRSQIESLFPGLLPTEAMAAELPQGSTEALALAELQQIAVENSPVILQAAAEVEKARGQAIQTGLNPNPIIGYEGDSIGTSRGAGYNGLYFSQEIVTAGKLGYARAAAMMEMRAAEQDLRKARVALASAVRRGYFALLVAEEQLSYSQAMAALTEEVYRSQIDLVAAGEAAAFQPLQLRIYAVEAQNQVVQARNKVAASWRSLVASLGVPLLERMPLAGSAEASAPVVSYQGAAAWLASSHTDLAAAQAMISSAGFNLRLQQVTPIPNLEIYSAFQHDDTTPLNDFAANVQFGLPVPIFDRNQGNITSAQAGLIRAEQDLVAKRNGLLGELADVYGRYSANRVVVENYRQDVLPDQVRVYRGVFESYRQASGDVDFAQLVVVQQSLAAALQDYVQALSDQWNAGVDLAELLQIDDFFALGEIVAPSAGIAADGR